VTCKLQSQSFSQSQSLQPSHHVRLHRQHCVNPDHHSISLCPHFSIFRCRSTGQTRLQCLAVPGPNPPGRKHRAHNRHRSGFLCLFALISSSTAFLFALDWHRPSFCNEVPNPAQSTLPRGTSPIVHQDTKCGPPQSNPKTDFQYHPPFIPRHFHHTRVSFNAKSTGCLRLGGLVAAPATRFPGAKVESRRSSNTSIEQS